MLCAWTQKKDTRVDVDQDLPMSRNHSTGYLAGNVSKQLTNVMTKIKTIVPRMPFVKTPRKDTCANVSPVLWTLPQKLPNIREECVINHIRHQKTKESRISIRIIVIPIIQDAGRTRFVLTNSTGVISLVSVVQMLSDSMMEAVDKVLLVNKRMNVTKMLFARTLSTHTSANADRDSLTFLRIQ